jgi:pyrrolidone-carboxylate peptidase
MGTPTLRHWLITSFAPFGGRAENASRSVQIEFEKISAPLEPTAEWQFVFHYCELPMEYDQCFVILMQEIERLKALGVTLEGVLSLGEGEEDFKIETQANNLDDVEGYADNRGVIRLGQRIFTDLDDSDTIPLRFPFEAFSRIRTSKNPGFFVCNHLCAKMGRAFSSDPRDPWFGFIHVPKIGSGGIFTPEIIATMILNGFKKIKT